MSQSQAVTGTGGAGGAGLQLTLYTYSARWLTEVSLSHQVHTRDIPTTHTNRNTLHYTLTLCHTKPEHYTLSTHFTHPNPTGETFFPPTDRDITTRSP